ncbi:MAG TPA: DNA alkylation repair protein [Bacteroidales bacterium]|nr:DNA alkylation repair protein [Bacteroidales bacterium]HPB25975.1 DNA alkylation repair protein [Bacteroidales bacterium]HQN15343.1 DNA alkylation repair protein [Bacteroidales bacterium]HQP16283.1 DNA alkylation repair protein [Bacteroidales bacterium]
MKETQDILHFLQEHSNPSNVKGMARFGIATGQAFGVPLPALRQKAKPYKKNHALALELWQSGYHEAQIMASMIDDCRQVTEAQMEQWAHDFDSWDVCDQCCSNLFDKTAFAINKSTEWTTRHEEFVKRAGFTMIACLAVHAKKMDDRQFIEFLPLIVRESTDDRNFVRKAVNWALRQIGKRNTALYPEALAVAQKLMLSENKTARWIGTDASKELQNEKIINRIKSKEK